MRVSRGTQMSTPWWILFPVMTPAGIMSMALALQRLERKVLVSGWDGPVDVALVEDHRAPGDRLVSLGLAMQTKAKQGDLAG
jgi:hypothetical protein